MIKVAIVEDDKGYRNKLQQSLNQYGKEKDIQFNAECFENGADFVFHYHAGFDIILMDIEMPLMNGMDAARKIRKIDSEVIIVFITNMANYAVQGYQVEAMDFIVKPFTYEVFRFRMERVISRLHQKRSDYSILLNSNDQIYRIKIADLLYVEVDQHTLIYHTGKENISVRGSLKQTESTLMEHGFCKCSQSYLVNMRHVTRVDSEDLFIGGTQIHISRGNKKEVIRSLTEFLANV